MIAVFIVALTLCGGASSFLLNVSLQRSAVNHIALQSCVRLLQSSGWKESSVFDSSESSPQDPPAQSPIPEMPSQLFQELALSQLELLASSMPNSANDDGGSKIESIALYLPQENSISGQLEFSPAVLYPHPSRERVFIANDSRSGVAPSMPRTLTKLPGFAHAASLLPAYPMVSMPLASDAGIGVVEEVFCDLAQGGTSLSVPLFAGSQTIGLLLVSPIKSPTRQSLWTKEDRQQVARAAKSLTLALSMDSRQSALRMQNQQVQEALSDSLHQFKNPLQALRTYGKLLQRRMADTGEGVSTPQLMELAEHLMVQSDRLVERLKPVDAIVDSLSENKRPPLLNPVEARALVPWTAPSLSWEGDALDFARDTLPKKTKTEKPMAQESSESTKAKANTRPKEPNGAQAKSLATTTPASLFGEMELEMAFIADTLEPVFSAFRAIAADRDISFEVEEMGELPGVVIWPLALQESLINVLDNAFKYVMVPIRPSTFRPRVRVRLLPNHKPIAPGVTVLVEDNGPGIAAEDRNAVFERGVRGRRSALAVDGSGIGLDIARSLMKQMGGTLRVVENDLYRDALEGAILELVVFRNKPK